MIIYIHRRCYQIQYQNLINTFYNKTAITAKNESFSLNSDLVPVELHGGCYNIKTTAISHTLKINVRHFFIIIVFQSILSILFGNLTINKVLDVVSLI